MLNLNDLDLIKKEAKELLVDVIQEQKQQDQLEEKKLLDQEKKEEDLLIKEENKEIKKEEALKKEEDLLIKEEKKEEDLFRKEVLTLLEENNTLNSETINKDYTEQLLQLNDNLINTNNSLVKVHDIGFNFLVLSLVIVLLAVIYNIIKKFTM